MSPKEGRAPGFLSRPLACVVIVSAVSFAWAATGWGVSSAQSPTVQITSTSAESWPSIEVTVTVVDASGQPITGLPPEAFSAALDGADLGVSGVQTTSDPGIGVAVVLTFDVSGSMAGPPLENAQAAGQALVEQLGASDQAAIMAFADKPVVIQQFTTDKGVLAAAINSLAAGGNTGLYTGVEESVRLANIAPLPRRAIVLLSDGYNFGVDTSDPTASLEVVSDNPILFMSIGLGDDVDQDYLSQLAAAGRGQFRIAPAPEDLTAAYRAAADVLRQQYVLSLDARSRRPQEADGGTLRVQVSTGGNVFAGEATISLPAAFLATPMAPVVTPGPNEIGPAPAAVDTAAQSSGGNPAISYVLVAGGGAAAIAVCGTLVWRRRKPGRATEALDSQSQGLERFERESRPVSFPSIQRAVVSEGGKAWLEVPLGRQVVLGDAPVTIGFSSDCVVTLSNGTSQRTERARIWRRDGNYMIHNLSRVGGVAIGGRAVTWAVLEDGDEIEIGGCKLVFRDAPPADAAKI